MSSPGSDKRYKIIDEDGNEFQLDHGSLTLLDDSFSVDVDIIERSFTDGAVAPGEERATMKELAFRVDLNKIQEQNFRSITNNLFYWLRKARVLRDVINNIETDVRLSEKSIQYEQGAFLHSSVINFTFTQIIPFWRDIEFQEFSETESGSNILSVNNDGFYDTPAYFILTAKEEVPKFLIKELNTGLGIGINDLQFGKLNLDTYVIDNENGEALLGSAETGGIKRNNRILSGTGFFFLRRGINDLIVYTFDNVDVDFTCKFKRRYFI